MRSIGIDLEKHRKKGLLRFEAWRPTQSGLEMHLLRIHKLIEEFDPEVVIIDPVSNLMMGNVHEVNSMLMRLMDFLKTRQITAIFTSLTEGVTKRVRADRGRHLFAHRYVDSRSRSRTQRGTQPLHLRSEIARHGALQPGARVCHVTKGIRLLPVYVGAGIVLTGSARLNQEALERAEMLFRVSKLPKKRSVLASDAARPSRLKSPRCALNSATKEAESAGWFPRS